MLRYHSLLINVGFENTRSWLADVREHADPHLTCILVGNKADLCDDNFTDSAASPPSSPPKHSKSASLSSHSKRRAVPTEEAELFAKQEGLLFVEASAKSGQNVEAAFEHAARDILDKIKKGIFDDDRVSLHFCLLSIRDAWPSVCFLHRFSSLLQC